jgi:hypothetical protein
VRKPGGLRDQPERGWYPDASKILSEVEGLMSSLLMPRYAGTPPLARLRRL